MHQAAEGLTVSLEKCDIVQSAQTGIRAPRGRTHRAKKGGVQKQLGPAHQVAKPKIGDMSCTPKNLGVRWEEGASSVALGTLLCSHHSSGVSNSTGKGITCQK